MGKNIIGLAVASMLAIGMVGTGVWAHFTTNSEASTNNRLTAGTGEGSSGKKESFERTRYEVEMVP